MLAVKPKSPGKLSVLLHWRDGAWWWTHQRLDEWEKAPTDILDGGRDGWWIARREPQFGRNTTGVVVTTVQSWRYENGSWRGTGKPPTAPIQ